ncbi:MAG: MogA/MoaB family molybdenum cofactor biosynthesis protein [Elusimicrobiota bacterium]
MRPLKVAILTISDRAARGQYEDLSGPALAIEVARLGWETTEKRIVADDAEIIKAALSAWCQSAAFDLILTTGGTGLGPRDVTPEATAPLLEKTLPGLIQYITMRVSADNPLAALSRALAGSRATTLILNLPGNPQAAVENLRVAAAALAHARDMLHGHGHDHRHHDQHQKSAH